MNYVIGMKIKEIRTFRKVTQEEMAKLLETTRQRYSRLENGQVDISYVTIKKIADYLGVTTGEITIAQQENKELTFFFREKNTCDDVIYSVAKIEEILRVFHAHEKLYNQTRERSFNVD